MSQRQEQSRSVASAWSASSAKNSQRMTSKWKNLTAQQQAAERAQRESACAALLLRRFPCLASVPRSSFQALIRTTRTKTFSSRTPTITQPIDDSGTNNNNGTGSIKTSGSVHVGAVSSNVIVEEGQHMSDPVLMLIASGSVDVYMRSPFLDRSRRKHPQVLCTRLGPGDEMNAHAAVSRPVDEIEREITNVKKEGNFNAAEAIMEIQLEPSPYTLIASQRTDYVPWVRESDEKEESGDDARNGRGANGMPRQGKTDPLSLLPPSSTSSSASSTAAISHPKLLVYTLSLHAFRNLLCSQPMLYEQVQSDIVSHLNFRRQQRDRNTLAHTYIGGFSSDRTPFTLFPSHAFDKHAAPPPKEEVSHVITYTSQPQSTSPSMQTRAGLESSRRRSTGPSKAASQSASTSPSRTLSPSFSPSASPSRRMTTQSFHLHPAKFHTFSRATLRASHHSPNRNSSSNSPSLASSTSHPQLLGLLESNSGVSKEDRDMQLPPSAFAFATLMKRRHIVEDETQTENEANAEAPLPPTTTSSDSAYQQTEPKTSDKQQGKEKEKAKEKEKENEKEKEKEKDDAPADNPHTPRLLSVREKLLALAASIKQRTSASLAARNADQPSAGNDPSNITTPTSPPPLPPLNPSSNNISADTAASTNNSGAEASRQSSARGDKRTSARSGSAESSRAHRTASQNNSARSSSRSKDGDGESEPTADVSFDYDEQEEQDDDAFHLLESSFVGQFGRISKQHLTATLLARAKARLQHQKTLARKQASQKAQQRIVARRRAQGVETETDEEMDERVATKSYSPTGETRALKRARSLLQVGTGNASSSMARRFSRSLHHGLFSSLQSSLAANQHKLDAATQRKIAESTAAAALQHQKARQRAHSLQGGMQAELSVSDMDRSMRRSGGSGDQPLLRRRSSALLAHAAINTVRLRPESASSRDDGDVEGEGEGGDASSHDEDRLEKLGELFEINPNDKPRDGEEKPGLKKRASIFKPIDGSGGNSRRSVPLFVTPTRNSNGSVLLNPDPSSMSSYAEFFAGALNAPEDRHVAAAQALAAGVKPEMIHAAAAARKRIPRSLPGLAPVLERSATYSVSVSATRRSGGESNRSGGSSDRSRKSTSTMDKRLNTIQHDTVRLLGFVTTPLDAMDACTIDGDRAHLYSSPSPDPLTESPANNGNNDHAPSPSDPTRTRADAGASTRSRRSFSFGHIIPPELQALVEESEQAATVAGTATAEAQAKKAADVAALTASSTSPKQHHRRHSVGSSPKRSHHHSRRLSSPSAVSVLIHDRSISPTRLANEIIDEEDGEAEEDEAEAPNIQTQDDENPASFRQLEPAASMPVLPATEQAPAPHQLQTSKSADVLVSTTAEDSCASTKPNSSLTAVSPSPSTGIAAPSTSEHGSKPLPADHRRPGIFAPTGSRLALNTLHPWSEMDWQHLRDRVNSVVAAARKRADVTLADLFAFQDLDNDAAGHVVGLGPSSIGLRAGQTMDTRAILAGVFKTKGVHALTILLKALNEEPPLYGMNRRKFKLTKEMSGDAMRSKKRRMRKAARERQERRMMRALKIELENERLREEQHQLRLDQENQQIAESSSHMATDQSDGGVAVPQDSRPASSLVAAQGSDSCSSERAEATRSRPPRISSSAASRLLRSSRVRTRTRASDHALSRQSSFMPSAEDDSTERSPWSTSVTGPPMRKTAPTRLPSVSLSRSPSGAFLQPSQGKLRPATSSDDENPRRDGFHATSGELAHAITFLTLADPQLIEQAMQQFNFLGIDKEDEDEEKDEDKEKDDAEADMPDDGEHSHASGHDGDSAHDSVVEGMVGPESDSASWDESYRSYSDSAEWEEVQDSDMHGDIAAGEEREREGSNGHEDVSSQLAVSARSNSIEEPGRGSSHDNTQAATVSQRSDSAFSPEQPSSLHLSDSDTDTHRTSPLDSSTSKPTPADSTHTNQPDSTNSQTRSNSGESIVKEEEGDHEPQLIPTTAAPKDSGGPALRQDDVALRVTNRDGSTTVGENAEQKGTAVPDCRSGNEVETPSLDTSKPDLTSASSASSQSSRQSSEQQPSSTTAGGNIRVSSSSFGSPVQIRPSFVTSPFLSSSKKQRKQQGAINDKPIASPKATANRRTGVVSHLDEMKEPADSAFAVVEPPHASSNPLCSMADGGQSGSSLSHVRSAPILPAIRVCGSYRFDQQVHRSPRHVVNLTVSPSRTQIQGAQTLEKVQTTASRDRDAPTPLTMLNGSRPNTGAARQMRWGASLQPIIGRHTSMDGTALSRAGSARSMASQRSSSAATLSRVGTASSLPRTPLLLSDQSRLSTPLSRPSTNGSSISFMSSISQLQGHANAHDHDLREMAITLSCIPSVEGSRHGTERGEANMFVNDNGMNSGARLVGPSRRMQHSASTPQLDSQRDSLYPHMHSLHSSPSRRNLSTRIGTGGGFLYGKGRSKARASEEKDPSGSFIMPQLQWDYNFLPGQRIKVHAQVDRTQQ